MPTNSKPRNRPPAFSRPSDSVSPAPTAAAGRTAAGTASNGTTAAGGSERQRRIAELAYFKAAQRGFAPGYEWEDWFAAEREVDAQS